LEQHRPAVGTQASVQARRYLNVMLTFKKPLTALGKLDDGE